ncbi:hypothetical protein TRFO_13683 [Tritrichomonas foetus]|uniref:Uncharacterized protein n=1 Tax=Tritrichomonas foetus TaxID=1144522 RepID=A0A1J4KX74_9EUKA|nr:hypothetical protein TRFO_13683 [Tritrichomonas foetus]|eukprot:OHT15857.1 hypothetical protein TRFO_13683 [Tritrichomonas foetus]
MGSNPSVAQAESRFLDVFQELSNQKEDAVDSVIMKSAFLHDLSCISNIDIQMLYKRQPSLVKELILKSLDFMVNSTDVKIVQGCIHILARFLPVLSLSIINPNELEWLFVGEKSEIVNLFNELKSLLFAPNILNEEDAENQFVWYWGTSLRHSFETSRTDALSILFFGHAGSFFFPNFPEIQEQNQKHACVESNITKYLIESIAEGIWWHNIHFMTTALPYTCLALANDSNFRSSLKDSQLLNRLSEIVYVPVDDLNVVIHYTYSLSTIEVDILLACEICLLLEPKCNYDVVKMTVAAIHYLQLANETNKINANHRIALTILSVVTSTKENGKLLEESILANLGTKFVFQTSSVALALLEALTNTVLMNDSNGILPLVISCLHNISPFITDSEKASSCIVTMIENAMKNDKKALTDALVVVIERYVTGDGDGNAKRETLKKLVGELAVFEGKSETKDQFLASIAETQLNHDFPLIIDQIESHITWAKSVVIQLFSKRNRITLEGIRKKSDK